MATENILLVCILQTFILHLFFFFITGVLHCRRYRTDFVGPTEVSVCAVEEKKERAPVVPAASSPLQQKYSAASADPIESRIAAAVIPSATRHTYLLRVVVRCAVAAAECGPAAFSRLISSRSTGRKRRCPTMYAVIQLDSENHRLRPKRVKMEFVCKYCNRTFNKHYSLLIHERNHMPSVNYRCEMCYKSFKRQDSLQQHRSVSKSH